MERVDETLLAAPPRRRLEWIPWSLFAALAARLVYRVSEFAVEVPFRDQWNAWKPLFEGSGPLTFFRLQHGPHRQGLGGLVVWASGVASGFSVRAEAFASAAIVIAGAGLGMLVARRVRGRLDVLDAFVPLVLLSGLHADAITFTPNPAHGPVPFLLLCAAPLCFAIPRAAVRLPLVVLLTASAAYTGFAVVAVPLLLAVQAVEAWRAPSRAAPVVALVASLLLSATFLVGYTPNSAAECFVFPDAQPELYLPFSALVLARPATWLPLPAALGWLVVTVVSLGVCAAALWGAGRTVLRARDETGRSAFLLCGAGLLLALATAVGRLCLGFPSAAMAPRYVPYVLPGLAVAWMVLRTIRPPAAARAAVAALALLVFAASEVALEIHPYGETTGAAAAKRQYLGCLRAGFTARACTRATGFEIYPAPEAIDLEGKLAFLRSRNLGPFANSAAATTSPTATTETAAPARRPGAE